MRDTQTAVLYSRHTVNVADVGRHPNIPTTNVQLIRYSENRARIYISSLHIKVQVLLVLGTSKMYVYTS